MLTRQELLDYRTRSDLSLRDVARYCDVTPQMIGQVERGENGLTESTYNEIIKGINTCKQKIADGTFEEEKAKESEDKKAKEQAKKEAAEQAKATKNVRKSATTKAKTE